MTCDLYLGDNYDLIKKHIAPESIDLIYLDPPFNSNADYQYINRNKSQNTSKTERTAFKDTWRWNSEFDHKFKTFNVCTNETLKNTLLGFELLLGKGSMLAYIMFLTVRLSEFRKILKPSGSIYLHCDQRASAYVRILMDSIFGSENYLNSIVWCYGLGGSSPRYWPRKHDDILWYSRRENQHYFQAVTIPATSAKMKGQYKKAPDFWNIPSINNMASERNGYPTQKPEALLNRIIESSSREGDTVLDPFCGSGTCISVAIKLKRNAIGIDINKNAIEITRTRVKDSVVPKIDTNKFP